MKTKSILRILALILMIAMASVLPVPMPLYNKDKQPKYFIEKIDKKKTDAEKDDVKEIT